MQGLSDGDDLFPGALEDNQQLGWNLVLWLGRSLSAWEWDEA